MRVHVLFFAVARERVGASRSEVDLDDGATVGALFERLVVAHPALADVLPACRAAVDEEFAPQETPLADGQTVAVLPPVSGGS